MDYAKEEKLKEMAQQQSQIRTQTAEGYGGAKIPSGIAGLGEPKRENLKGRIAAQLRQAGYESRKLEALHELSYLLEKNPEVARILDLMDAVREY